jgi:hypothetical protein
MPDARKASPDGWTSLERTKLGVDIAKTVASLLVSISLFYLGQQYATVSSSDAANRAAAEKEQAREHERLTAVIKQRVALWDQISGNLNDVYCYFLFVGQWKQLSPDDVIARKRSLDKTMYSYRPFFSDAFFERYLAFVAASFRTYGGFGEDAQLRTIAIRPLDSKKSPRAFTGEDNSSAVHKAYYALMQAAGEELDVKIQQVPPKPETPTSKEQLEDRKAP